MTEPLYYEELIRSVVSGRKIIVCADALVGAWARAKAFRELGALRPFLIAGTLGTGEPPTPEDADTFVLGTAASTLMQGIRHFEQMLDDPPTELLAALDRYDPDREALVIGTIFMRSGPRFDRRTYGTREPAWEALEDKMIIDAVLDDAGVARAPSAIVAADADAIAAAHERLDRGLGTAIAGDAREGWWGGAEYLRWVRDRDEAHGAAADLGAHCDRVRVMPFLDGIPCSVHAFVLPDTVLAFRPVEMLTLRRPGSKLLYTGTATYWDPPDRVRDEMRTAARTLGAHLRERVGYRGTFTLDGVVTSEGFRPTELNARAGAGLTPMVMASGVNVPFLSRMATEGDIAGLRPADLEALVIERADATRRGSCYTVIPQPIEATSEHPVDGDGLLGAITLGPAAIGGFVAYRPESAHVAVGPSFAPTAVRAFAHTDAHHGTNLGPLEPATDIK